MNTYKENLDMFLTGIVPSQQMLGLFFTKKKFAINLDGLVLDKFL